MDQVERWKIDHLFVPPLSRGKAEFELDCRSRSDGD